MSLNTRYPSPIIISGLAPDNDAPLFLSEEAGTTADGWDTVSQSYALLAEEPKNIDHIASTVFPVGQVLTDRNFWVQSVGGFKCITEHLYRFTVTYKGMAGGKPVVVDYDAGADQQTGENIMTPDGFFESVATHENTPTATARYFTTTAGTVPTQDVGRAKVPPSAPGVAPSVWDSLEKFTYHWPNGWVLMSSKVTRLPGTNVALVSDRYKFIRAITPRT